jgi:hypothetical protein
MIKVYDSFVFFCSGHSRVVGMNYTDSLGDTSALPTPSYSTWTEYDPPNSYKGIFDGQEQMHACV